MTQDKTTKVKDTIENSLNHSHYNTDSVIQNAQGNDYVYDANELDAWIEKIMD